MPSTIDPVGMIVSWLTAHPVDGMSVSTLVPADRDPPFTTVRRTGGQIGLLHDMPLLTVRCWHTSEADAMKAGRLTLDALRRMSVEYPAVHMLDALSLYTDRDPDTGRWYAELNLQVGLAPTLPELH